MKHIKDKIRDSVKFKTWENIWGKHISNRFTCEVTTQLDAPFGTQACLEESKTIGNVTVEKVKQIIVEDLEEEK